MFDMTPGEFAEQQAHIIKQDRRLEELRWRNREKEPKMHTEKFVITITTEKPIKELKSYVENRLHSMDKVEKVLAVPVIAQSETIANRFYTTSRADEAEPGSRPGA